MARRDGDAAVAEVHRAYLKAIASRRWDALLDVGDAYRRAHDAGISSDAMRRRMIQSYWTAAGSALRSRSREGVLRIAEAFASLGDADVTAQIIQAAERTAVLAGDPHVRELMHLFRERIAGRRPAIDALVQPAS